MTKAIENSAETIALFKVIVLLSLAFLCACSSPPKQYSYSIKGEGDQILNRDTNGKSLSVVVRIYQLKDANEFSKLTFDTLAAGYPESDLLGPSLLLKSDVIIIPGGSYTSSEKLLDDTRFIGIVGLFRNPDPHHWRQLVDVSETGTHRNAGLSFRAQDCYLVVNGTKSILLPGQPPAARSDCGTGNLSSLAPARPPIQARTYPAERSPLPAANGQPQSSAKMPQTVPDLSINVPSSVAPANVRMGGPGGSTITIGESAQPVPPGYYAPSGSPPPTYYAPPGYYTPPGTYVPPR